MKLQNRINRINHAQDLVRDLVDNLESVLRIQACDAEVYYHFHSSYPNEVFNALALVSSIFNDWLDDLHAEARNNCNRKAV